MLIDIDFDISQGYYPSTSSFPPKSLWNTIKAGRGIWLREGGKLQKVNGAQVISFTNVGARIYAVNNDRGEIAGGLVAGRLPNASILRYQNAVLYFLSEITSQQVYLNEIALAGVTTAATAGMLRVAVPITPTTYNTYDAGFDPPIVTGITTVTGTKGMLGETAVSLCAWRSVTNATSAPSAPFPAVLDGGANSRFLVPLPAPVAGQDGFVMGGTAWGDTTMTLYTRRFIYIVPRGVFFATNGSPTITGEGGTFWLQDLQVGDFVDIDGGTYEITAITDNATASITPNFVGVTGGAKTMTELVVAGEWYDGEKGPYLPYDVFKPIPAAGAFQFLGRVFLWGTDGAIGSVTGPGIRVMLETNPEHIGLFALLTTDSADLLNVLPADQTCYLMTRTSLEVVVATGNASIPFRVRVLHKPGFRTASAGVVYKNRFYGYAQRPLRTVTDGDIDVQFGKPVFSDMQSWSPDNVVLSIDPKNEAVLYCHFDGSQTMVIPFMAQLEELSGRPIWNPPQFIPGRIVDTVVVGGEMYFVVLSGGVYRVWQWENGGASGADAFMATQYISGPNRFKAKGLVFAGTATTLYLYAAQIGVAIGNQSVAAQATASFPLALLSGILKDEIFTNLPPCRAVAFRMDFQPVPVVATEGEFQSATVRVMPLEERR